MIRAARRIELAGTMFELDHHRFVTIPVPAALAERVDALATATNLELAGELRALIDATIGAQPSAAGVSSRTRRTLADVDERELDRQGDSDLIPDRRAEQ